MAFRILHLVLQLCYYDKFNDWTYSGGDAAKVLSKDDMLDDITLYWLTNTSASSSKTILGEQQQHFDVVEQRTREISARGRDRIPGEIYQAP